MPRFRLFLAALTLSVLTACAALGVESPDTFNQRLAVAAASVTEVRNTATTLLVAGKISVADAQNIQQQADVAREGLNVARGLSATSIPAASTRLEVATAALRALQTYLIAKQGAKP